MLIVLAYLMFYCKKQICTQITSILMVPIFYGHTKSQQRVTLIFLLLAIKQQPFCKYRVNGKNSGLVLLWALRKEKRQKNRLVVTKQSRYCLKCSKHLFWKPQILVITGQLLRRKQKAERGEFIPIIKRPSRLCWHSLQSTIITWQGNQAANRMLRSPNN